MIFKPKISHQKPIKPPLKADFNAYFTQKRMIFTPIYKICATPKGPFRVRFPAGVPSKKEPSGSFLFGFRCGNQPAVRPTACGGTRSAATKYSRRKLVGASPHTNAAANEPPDSAVAIAPSVMNARPMSSFCHHVSANAPSGSVIITGLL